MDESLTGKSMDESLTGRPPFKPLGLPHRITSSNSATNLHGTDELDDSDRDGRVLVLLTGGTMGMKPNARGSLEPKAGYLAEQMRLMPELRERRMPAYEVVEYAPLLDSADMVPQDWRRIAQDIAQSHNQFDGFVVIMGTDTMAYCASALSFMLEGLSKPVVLTGSMIPFAESYSDARRNLVMALIFAHAGPSEVVVFFGDRLLRGNRTTKVDALALSAYDSPNFPPLASCGVALRARYDLALAPSSEQRCKAFTQMETKILVFRMVPGFDDKALLRCLESDELRAVVLELYGTGTAPARRAGLLKALRAARSHNVLVVTTCVEINTSRRVLNRRVESTPSTRRLLDGVHPTHWLISTQVATTQCKRGGVVLATYEVGRLLEEEGVVAAGDMTTEAAATKLAYLFGRYPGDMDAVRELVGVSLRGEISHPDAYLRPFFEAPRYKSSGSIESDPTKRPPAPPPAPTQPPPRDVVQRRDVAQRRRDIALGAALGVGLALVLARRR
jgi:L-asparaginase